jgi:hypothetical protein
MQRAIECVEAFAQYWVNAEKPFQCVFEILPMRRKDKGPRYVNTEDLVSYITHNALCAVSYASDSMVIKLSHDKYRIGDLIFEGQIHNDTFRIGKFYTLERRQTLVVKAFAFFYFYTEYLVHHACNLPEVEDLMFTLRLNAHGAVNARTMFEPKHPTMDRKHSSKWVRYIEHSDLRKVPRLSDLFALTKTCRGKNVFEVVTNSTRSGKRFHMHQIVNHLAQGAKVTHQGHVVTFEYSSKSCKRLGTLIITCQDSSDTMYSATFTLRSLCFSVQRMYFALYLLLRDSPLYVVVSDAVHPVHELTFLRNAGLIPTLRHSSFLTPNCTELFISNN